MFVLEELFLLSRTAAETRQLLLALRDDVNATWINASVWLTEKEGTKRRSQKRAS
jgi:hypothetical protein